MQSMNPNAPAPASAEDEGVPVSTKIRERLKAARQRYHANDNIASFIQPGELEQLLDEVTAKMQGVLESLVIDTEDDHNTAPDGCSICRSNSFQYQVSHVWTICPTLHS